MLVVIPEKVCFSSFLVVCPSWIYLVDICFGFCLLSFIIKRLSSTPTDQHDIHIIDHKEKVLVSVKRDKAYKCVSYIFVHKIDDNDSTGVIALKTS